MTSPYNNHNKVAFPTPYFHDDQYKEVSEVTHVEMSPQWGTVIHESRDEKQANPSQQLEREAYQEKQLVIPPHLLDTFKKMEGLSATMTLPLPRIRNNILPR